MRTAIRFAFLTTLLAISGCDQGAPTGNKVAANAMDSPEDEDDADRPAAQAEAQVGRFVIIHSPEAERDTILLDTATGRTWSRVEFSDVTDNPVAWEPMPQLNTDADTDALVSRHGLKKSRSPSDTDTPAPSSDDGG